MPASCMHSQSMFDVSEEFAEVITRQFIVLLGASVFPMIWLMGAVGASDGAARES